MRPLLFCLAILASHTLCLGESVSRADSLFTAGKYGSAAREYHSVIKSLGHEDASLFGIRTKYLNALEKDGRYQMALDASEDFLSSGIYSVDEIVSATNLMLRLGQYSRAEKTLADYIGTISSPSPAVLTNYASALAYQGKHKEAIDILENYKNDAAIRKDVLQNLGYIHAQMGDYKGAIDYYNDAEEYAEGINRYILLSNSAVAYAHTGDFKEALRRIDTAIAGFDSAGKDGILDYNGALRKKAEIAMLAKDFKLAKNTFLKFFNSERRWIQSNLSSFTPQQRLDIWAKEKYCLSKCFLLEDKAPEFLADVAIFRRQTSLIGNPAITGAESKLNLKSSDIRESLDKGEAAVEFIRYEDMEGNDRYGAIILSKKGPVRFARLFEASESDNIDDTATPSPMKIIRNEDKTDLDRLYNDSIWGDSIWKPVISSLPADISRIYFAPEGIFHLWNIENMPFDTSGSLELMRVSSLGNVASRKARSRQGHGERKPMLVIGGLDYDRESRGCESTTTVADNEASSFLRSKLGNVFNIFTYLEGTRVESDTISAITGNSVLSHEIGESMLKRVMPDYDIVHIATHGYSLNFGIKKQPEAMCDSIPLDLSMLACGIALTGANLTPTSGDDNIMSAKEISSLDLSGVEFVVLSACQTAKGEIFDEGSAGLIRGFKNAGVKTVMATLWEVNDLSTMCFMREFYKGLNTGMTKYEAFRNAQDFLKTQPLVTYHPTFSPATLSKGKRFTTREFHMSAPYYWAPFILVDAFD